jgi:predicted dithiol-disulfide oxidoreductase (DUF899 family)
VRKGKNFPKDVIEHWPEVFGEISLNVIPLHYLDSVIVTFKNGKNWEINFTNHSQEKFEIELKEWLSEYENEIDNIDFRLDTERIKKDVQKNTNKFLKNKKLK